ncbi:retron Ec78 anti-phage system effector HNH endonuclease PtuB [Marinomonas primoryensis]|uniref:retron Ec78 anti-phage system effector HNH endonuclease PtuB n=1 Tax=Marinomonas primoryensis TaxID=178399 RepID=UPI0030DBBD83|tara:strand:+ start:3265 stop:3945 length:681 start_codon:yes stop_codon:yes gene_type:complete
MRKLNRPPKAPRCLAKCDYKKHKWGQRFPRYKKDIWEQLDVMHDGFCAYCEALLVEDNKHIEHFFRKGEMPDGTAPYKHLTFDWNNLFGSCGKDNSDTCGHYKDREGPKGPKGPGAYDPRDLIKPDIEDPRDFLTFQNTGIVEPKIGLSDENLKRATETIRVLRLDFPALNGVRETQIKIFKKNLDNLALLSSELDDENLFNERENIKREAAQSEFQTAILDALGL